jgi:hypothetical protein
MRLMYIIDKSYRKFYSALEHQLKKSYTVSVHENIRDVLRDEVAQRCVVVVDSVPPSHNNFKNASKLVRTLKEKFNIPILCVDAHYFALYKTTVTAAGADKTMNCGEGDENKVLVAIDKLVNH